MMDELDAMIRQSLTEFTDDVFHRGWFGKEREAVSLYAFGFLVPRCKPDRFLRDPTQIGIEVRVPQLAGPTRKKEVCKDLIIWPEPWMNCWDAENQSAQYPAAVVQWKVTKFTGWREDEAWLSEFSKELNDFVGYAVRLDLEQRNFRLSCTRVHKGRAQPEWLYIQAAS